MATLSSFFAVYTDGAPLTDSFKAPSGVEVFVGEMETLTLPGTQDELFGPHVAAFKRFKPKRAYLLGFRRELKGRAEPFFTQVRGAFLEATHGITGHAIDVLRLFPFPLDAAGDVLPEHVLAEDLFSVGFTDMGEHGVRAESIGLSKLGQREITFEFGDPTLMEEAALLCGHLADWLLEHNRRVEHGQFMSFGFDRLAFFAAEGEGAAGPFRGWHPALVQKLVPERLFEGLGVLDVRSMGPGHDAPLADLSVPLRRSLEQRMLLEELNITGDSPNSSSTAQVRGAIEGLSSLTASREEAVSSKDSGWRLRAPGDPSPRTVTLAEVATKAPDLVRYLALPHGVRLSFDGGGRVTIDTSRIELEDDSLEDDGE